MGTSLAESAICGAAAIAAGFGSRTFVRGHWLGGGNGHNGRLPGSPPIAITRCTVAFQDVVAGGTL